ncbi:cation diffusion facilitator family transporter [Luteibaculum oceani]|uniref:Cation transporter n=1 Tax=Luteibaculum oceani TaxID=1294296 RepID=A0A5C6VAB2_9FLAO|nr:cation diffusion facilitator family transporter [Luteibaculum oceani]TXC81734.1 cation transporter [Luteibaculum oceani]
MTTTSFPISLNRNRLEPNNIFSFALLIPGLVFLFEVFYGFILENLIILACSLRTLSHLLSVVSERLQKRFTEKGCNPNYPLGYGKLSNLFDFSAGISMLFICFIVGYYSINQVLFPEVHTIEFLMEIALLDVCTNFISLLFLQGTKNTQSQKKNLGTHFLANALLSTLLILVVGIIWATQLYFFSGILGLIITAVVARWSFGTIWISGGLLLDLCPNKNLPKKIRTDLYNKFDTIVAVDKIQVWQIAEKKNAAIIRLKLYPGEIYEYRFLKREITNRVQRKFQIEMVAVEFDW